MTPDDDTPLEPASYVENDRSLALWFTPSAILDHFDADAPLSDVLAEMSDETLRQIGEAALGDDALYETFHRVLLHAINTVAPDHEPDHDTADGA